MDNTSILLIQSSDPRNSSMGTGFVIYQDALGSYLLTCDHVVQQVKTPIIKGLKAETISTDSELDLALLYVNGLFRTPFKLQQKKCPSLNVELIGFSNFSQKNYQRKTRLATLLDNGMILESVKSNREVKTWEVVAKENSEIESGNSGAPLICQETGNVIAVVSHKKDLSRGYAISIEYLQELWADMPASLFQKYDSVSEHLESALGPLVTYMVDRTDQELKLRSALNQHENHQPRHPHILLVYGKQGHAMEEYLHRMQESSLPLALRSMQKPDIVKWSDMNWSTNSTNKKWAENVEALMLHLDQQIELEFGLKPESWPDSAPRVLSGLKKALILCYRVRYDNWNEMHITALKEWIHSWTRIAPLNPTHPFIILFSVEYDDRKLSWLDKILHRQKDTETHPIVAQIQQLTSVGGSEISVSVLPELGNVTFQDIEQWIRKHVKPPDPPAMIRKAKEILDDLDILMEDGLPMDKLGEKLEILLRTALEVKNE